MGPQKVQPPLFFSFPPLLCPGYEKLEMEQETCLPKPVAVIACAAMAFFYVAIVYAPSLILRLPPPSSFKEFMIRRFACAAISSIVSVVFCAFILPIRSVEESYLFGAYGIRLDLLWQAAVFPLFLTSLMYAGSLVLKVLYGWIHGTKAPLTEELVFRSCMVPLLLCAGFKIYGIIFLCPILFSLGHLLAPLVAHIFCNFMGFTRLFARRKGTVSLAFVARAVAWLRLLFPLTRPDLYNDRTNNCRCWRGYCSWN